MSEWHAINILEDAIEKTKKLLFSRQFNTRFWLKLALVVFVTAGAANLNFNYNLGGEDLKNVDLTAYLPIIAVAVVIILLVSLTLAYVAAVFNFLFLESVINEKVEVTDGVKRHARNGLKLFGFNILVGIISLITVLALILPAILFYTSDAPTWLLIAYAIVGLIFLLALILLASIIGSFTVDFVVPLMYHSKSGLLDCWSNLLTLIKNNFKQFLVYIAAKLVLGVVAAAAYLIVTILLLILAVIFVGIPLIAAAIIAGMLFDVKTILSSSPIMFALILAGVVAVIILSAIISYVSAVITLPIPVFFRYYSILFLQKIQPKTVLLKNTELKKTDDSSAEKETPKQTNAETEGKKTKGVYV